MQAIPENIKASLNAKVSQKNAALVCAYMKPPLLSPAGSPKVLTDSEGKLVSGVPPVAAVGAPAMPGSKLMDTTSKCETADNAVLVKNGEVTFYHLHPQNYDFRLFMSDGSFQDFSNIQFLPAEKKSLVW